MGQVQIPNYKYRVPKLPTLLSNLTTNQGFRDSLLKFSYLLQWLIELRERIYSLLLVYYIGYLKDKNGLLGAPG